MKKMAIILVVALLSVPSLAAVTCTATCDGDANTVTISYSTDANLPRAFALDITMDNGATFDSVASSSVDYWVFPGTIDINDATGDVDSNGTPIAPSGDPGAQTGLGTGGITIEMGSLYDGSPNAPAANGALLVLNISRPTDSNTTVTLAENTTRAGVVMENVDEDITPTLTGCVLEAAAVEPDCYAGAPDEAEWTRIGKPECWCYAYQCKGDTDAEFDGKNKNGARKYVSLSDLTLFNNAWQKVDTDTLFNISGGGGGAGYCADFAHDYDGKNKDGARKHVSLTDLTIFNAGWQKVDTDTHFTSSPCYGTLKPNE